MRIWSVGPLCLALTAAARPVRAQDADPLPSPLRLEQVVQIAHDHRAEIVAAQARARASAQRPAIVSALDDPMIFPTVDHAPFSGAGGDARASKNLPAPCAPRRHGLREASHSGDVRRRAATIVAQAVSSRGLRDVIDRTSTWESIPLDPDGDLRTGTGKRFTYTAATGRIDVLTDDGGLYVVVQDL